MKRITMNDKNHILASLNMFYCRDGEVWVRHGGPEPDYPDATLVDVIREIAKAYDLAIEAEGPESLGDEMYDAMFDGVSTVEGIVALFHAAAVQAAEMQGRLKAIEDILGDDYELDRLGELVEADREGRCGIPPVKIHQKIFRVFDGEIYEEVVCGAIWEPLMQRPMWKVFVMGHGIPYFVDEVLGKTVFLTRAEAEAALRREQDG